MCAPGQTTPSATPGPRSSSPWPIIERSCGRSHPFILLYPIKIHRTGKPRPGLSRTRARVPSCPARGGSRPRGDARTSGMRAQPRNTDACVLAASGAGRNWAKHHYACLHITVYGLQGPERVELRGGEGLLPRQQAPHPSLSFRLLLLPSSPKGFASHSFGAGSSGRLVPE